TLGYQSSSYLTDRVPALGLVDLPFLFRSTEEARAAMDGALGQALARRIEDQADYRILGWFEDGFRHISHRTRSVRTPSPRADVRSARRLRGRGAAPHRRRASAVRQGPTHTGRDQARLAPQKLRAALTGSGCAP